MQILWPNDNVEDEEIARMLERGEIEEGDIVMSVETDEIIIPPGGRGVAIDVMSTINQLKSQGNTQRVGGGTIVRAPAAGGPLDLMSAITQLKLQGESMSKFHQARLRFKVFSKMEGNSIFTFERYYRELYDDIKANHDLWFDVLFDKPGISDKTAVILGTLCTILRQKGDLISCMKVMPTHWAVLEKYKQTAYSTNDPGEKHNADMLIYKANTIRINCGLQLRDKDMAVKAFRDIVAQEKIEKAAGRYDAINDPEYIADYDGVVEMLIGHNDYDEVSDDDIYAALGTVTGYGPGSPKSVAAGPDVKLSQCGCCKKEEGMHGDFKKCSRCHEQAYCSKQCQVRDWKVHKLLCGEKNTTNIESSTLLSSAELLLESYTTTRNEEGRSGPVSQAQKNDAKAGLVKQLKVMYTSRDFQQYNSMAAFGDAPYDPAFSEAIAKFFANQPGYEEVWGPLSVVWREMKERQKQRNEDNNILNISDEAIRERCEDIARTFKMHCGHAWAEDEGGISDFLDQRRHEVLIESLEQLTKKFARENPQYNSYAGLVNMANDVDFIKKVALAIACCYDERGPQIDTLQEELLD